MILFFTVYRDGVIFSLTAKNRHREHVKLKIKILQTHYNTSIMGAIRCGLGGGLSPLKYLSNIHITGTNIN